MNAVERAKSETKQVLQKVNSFFESNWKEYQQKVEALNISLFKERTQIE